MDMPVIDDLLNFLVKYEDMFIGTFGLWDTITAQFDNNIGASSNSIHYMEYICRILKMKRMI